MVRRRRAIQPLRRKQVPKADQQKQEVKRALRDASVLEEAAKIRKDTSRFEAAKRYSRPVEQSVDSEQVKGK